MASRPSQPERPTTRLEALLTVTGRLAGAPTLPLALEALLEAVVRLGGADAAALWLRAPAGVGVRLGAVHGLDRERLERELPAGGWLVGEALRTGRPLGVRAYPTDRRANRWLAEEVGVGSALALPLPGRRSVGVLVALSRGRGGFTARPARVLAGLAGQAGLAIGRFRAEAERDELSERFRRADKLAAIGRLAVGVAHDFNNLLTVISGYAELALVGTASDDPNREFAEQISAASQRASTVTRQLLLFGHRHSAAPEVLDLNRAIGELEKPLRRVVGETVELIVVPEPGLWPVTFDPARLEQVLLGLVVEAHEVVVVAGGRLIVTTGNAQPDPSAAPPGRGVRSGQHVVLTVVAEASADPGAGPSAAPERDGLGPPPPSPTGAGAPGATSAGAGRPGGLGLSAVSGIVAEAGGELRASHAPGRGATFEVRLPRPEGATRPTEVGPVAGDLPRGSERVMVVEDEEQLRSLMSRVLEQCGYTVVACSGGVEALRVAARQAGPIDLLVTDVVMPHMSGPELASYLLAVRPPMRTLYVSGYTDPAITQRAGLEAGAPFLSKPFTPAALAAKVREVLDEPSR
jgi:signal transduction histidine kinase/CheY-like chemotaxis protein